MTWTPTYDLSRSPVAFDYLTSEAFFSCITGPVGSGKSYASLIKPMLVGQHQQPGRDSKRRTRGVVVRNTMPELRGTTIQTYQNLYPEDRCGPVIYSAPATHMISPRGSDIEIEVNFIALDKPKDVKKLLSLEITWAFLNEVREMPRVIVNRMGERVGRYGIDDRPNTWSGVWADTNPPDVDHYLYAWDKLEESPTRRFYHQPPGVLEVKRIEGAVEIIDENFPRLRGRRMTEGRVWSIERGEMVTCPIEAIESGGRLWIVNPGAENLHNLWRVNPTVNPLGPESYYGRALAGKSLPEIRSYLQGVYSFVTDGRPVIPQYDDETQAITDLPVLKDEDLWIAVDVGGGTLQPSAIIGQTHPDGAYLAHDEVVCFDMGIENFCAVLGQRLQQQFSGMKPRVCWGDPAGEKRDEIYETKVFDFIARQLGIRTRAAPSQDPPLRQAAISGPCERIIRGKPGLLINKGRCRMLRKGLSGGWHFRRVQVVGEERYAETPSKNDFSHPCDALGYGLLGEGEFTRLGGRERRAKRAWAGAMNTDFAV